MTYTPSHLGMAVILFSALTPKSTRKWAKDHPVGFAVLTLMAILPDIDIYLQIPHRTWTHSLLVIGVVGIVLNIITLHPSLTRWRTPIHLTIFFWLTHVFFDLTFDSVAIFYPLDKAFYNFVGGVVLDISAPTPRFSHITLNREFITPKQGIDQFFVNWSAERRVEYFGRKDITLIISQFTVHVGIFIYYLSKVIFPALSSMSKRHGGLLRSRLGRAKRFPRFNHRISLANVMLLMLLVSFFFAGQGNGSTYEGSEHARTGFYVLSDGISVYSELSFTIPEKSSAEILIKFPTHALNFSIAFGTPDEGFRSRVSSNVSSLSEAVEAGNITAAQFHQELQSEISLSLPGAWTMYNVSSVDTTVFSINFPYSEQARTYTLGMVLASWSLGDYFIYAVDADLIYTVSRSEQVRIATISLFTTLSALLVLNLGALFWSKNKQKSPVTTDIH